jgi:adenylosuccinate lyase
MMDLEDIEIVREKLQFRGAQGTTGSQATFLELFEGDASKIVQLNEVHSNSSDLHPTAG